jgi:membrane-anchored protein YejM (alkaline phosphatase superfamily)
MSARAVLLKKGFCFFLLNSILLLLVATRYFQYFQDVKSFLTIFYLVLATVSHFSALSLLIYVLLYVPAVAIFPRETFAKIWAAIIAMLGLTVLLLDTFVYQLYHFHINSFVLDLVFGGAGGQIFEFHALQYVYVVGFILLLLALFIFIVYKCFKWQDKYSLKRGWIFTLAIALMMFLSHFIHAWADAANYIPITRSSRYYPLYYPTVNKGLMLKIGVVDSIQSNNNGINFSNQDKLMLNYPKNALQMDKNCKTNIILILIDSWYYKSFDSIVMPNIYRFSKQCEVYNHHYSGSNGTRTGLFSIFYSIPGLFWDDVLASQTSPIFVDELLKNNYQVQVFPSASLVSPPFDRTIFKKIKNLNVDTEGEDAFSRDKQITHEWLNMTSHSNAQGQPFFGFVFYDDLHAIVHPKSYKGPFQPEWEYAKYEQLSNNTDPQLFLNLYKNCAHYVDSLVGVVLNDLKNRGLLDNSWVIITGDHGQEFNDNKKNYWGHNGNYSAAQMQVPFLLYKPNGKHKVYTHFTSHYDIVPTIFSHLWNCKNSVTDYSIGKCLNDSTNRDWLLCGSKDNFAIIQPNKITSIYFDGSYDITDAHLNELKGEKMNAPLINQIMNVSNSFYKK